MRKKERKKNKAKQADYNAYHDNNIKHQSNTNLPRAGCGRGEQLITAGRGANVLARVGALVSAARAEKVVYGR